MSHSGRSDGHLGCKQTLLGDLQRMLRRANCGLKVGARWLVPGRQCGDGFPQPPPQAAALWRLFAVACWLGLSLDPPFDVSGGVVCC